MFSSSRLHEEKVDRPIAHTLFTVLRFVRLNRFALKTR